MLSVTFYLGVWGLIARVFCFGARSPGAVLISCEYSTLELNREHLVVSNILKLWENLLCHFVLLR